MLRILTSNNGEVFRHLGGVAFRRLDIDHVVAADARGLLAKVAELRPDMVLLDARLPDGSGFEVSRQIKDPPDLAATRVILLLAHVISRSELDGVAQSRCDDVLVLPLSADDFYHHIATMAGLPVRRTPRIGIELTLGDGPAAESIVGSVMNVNPAGLGVRVSQPLANDQHVHAVVRLEGERCQLSGRVAWSRPAEDGEPGYLAGIVLEGEMPIRARLVLEQLSLFAVLDEPDDSELPGAAVVVLQGDFTEAMALTGLIDRLKGESRIVFDAAGVRYISSAGVKSWCELVATLKGKEYVFRHCSIAFASQIAMVPLVLGTGRVVSLQTPYHCPTCQRDDLRLLETRALLREGAEITPPALRCPVCAGELEFDDVPNRYFAFMHDVDETST